MEELESPHARLGIRFHRAFNIKFDGFLQILGLYIQRIDKRGWEKLRFEVGDCEEDRIHLYCHQVTLFDPNKEGCVDAKPSNTPLVEQARPGRVK